MSKFNLAVWLSEQGSLTNTARNYFSNVQIQIIQAGWHADPITNESLFFREILMLCDDIPRWYAKLSVPRQAFNWVNKEFDLTAHQAIGDWLFQPETKVKRSWLACKKIYPQDPLYDCALKYAAYKPDFFWGRVAEFDLLKAPFALEEVYLEA